MTTPMKPQSDRAFGLMFACVFAILFGAIWSIFDIRWNWAAILAAAFLAVSLLVPWTLLPLNRLWGRFAFRVGHVNNHLILGLFFYLVMLPTGLMMRLFGQDPMARRLMPKSESYWQPVRRNPDRENFTDMF